MATLKQRTKFTYEPLDTTQQSIRLISVDPELSPEGFVQCSIRHATIDAQYNCLSYRWGPPDLSNTLIINGQALSINGYLDDFLAEVRTFTYQAPDQSIASHLRENLWIDAVCIDQNSTSEKNHQVGQMGKIYANARKVVMWLGNRYSEYGREYPELPSPTLSDYNWFVIRNQYWTRAWIAQEVILAKDPVLMIADHLTRDLISFPDFVQRPMDTGDGPTWSLATFISSLKNEDSTDVLIAWKNMVYDRKDTAKKPGIVEWLAELQGVKCALIYDRIFSLLELSAEGKDVLVDYTMPVTQLVYHVFRARGPERCLCEVFLLVRVLQVTNRAIESSGACVYVHWKPDLCSRSPLWLCPNGQHAVFEEHARWHKLGIVKKFGKMIVQAPLRDFVAYRSHSHKICHGAIRGTPIVPVQMKLGPIYQRQIVSEDGEIQPLIKSDRRGMEDESGYSGDGGQMAV